MVAKTFVFKTFVLYELIFLSQFALSSASFLSFFRSATDLSHPFKFDAIGDQGEHDFKKSE
jgi:hypothetical protein